MSASSANKTPILGNSQATAAQMWAYLKSLNPQAPNYADLYLQIGNKYGVRGDLAFAQSIKETGAWKYGGSVQPDQNNFAGLGAVSPKTQGASFDTPAEGIEAQIQHLYGYATTAPLPEGTEIVDPRWDILVQSGLRGSAPYWENLNGKWAVPGDGYGQDIVRIHNRILQMPGGKPALSWKEEAVKRLKEEGLITSDHNPDDYVTWAELGVVIGRLIDKLE